MDLNLERTGKSSGSNDSIQRSNADKGMIFIAAIYPTYQYLSSWDCRVELLIVSCTDKTLLLNFIKTNVRRF